MDRITILRYLRKALKGYLRENQGTYENLVQAALVKLHADGHVSESQYVGLAASHPLKILLMEGYHQLLAKGYIVPHQWFVDRNDYNFVVTQTGREWATTEDPCPEDIADYIRYLDSLIPELDKTIKQYIVEAVTTYNREAFFASAVMLGAASEACVYLMAEALCKAVQNPEEKKAIGNLITEERKISKLFEKLAQYLNKPQVRKQMGYEIHEASDQHLLSLQQAIRIQRNDAVHPTIACVEPRAIRIGLSAFPFACRKIYDLTVWFNKNTL